MARTFTKLNKARQLQATTKKKRNRLKEAELGGRRTGKATATTQVAQARRDARRGEAGDLVPVVSPSKPIISSPPSKPTKSAKPRPSAVRKERTTPLIEIRTSSSIPGSARLDSFAADAVEQGLGRFANRLTRIDVHLSDENAAKRGNNDKRCQIEARAAARKPVSTTATAATIEKALTTAIGKMKRLLASQFDRPARG